MSLSDTKFLLIQLAMSGDSMCNTCCLQRIISGSLMAGKEAAYSWAIWACTGSLIKGTSGACVPFEFLGKSCPFLWD
jgi:hypothetical protein